MPNHESLKAYLAPTGLVSEPRGDLTCRGDLRLEVPKTGLTSAGWLGAGWLAAWLSQISDFETPEHQICMQHLEFTYASK